MRKKLIDLVVERFGLNKKDAKPIARSAFGDLG